MHLKYAIFHIHMKYETSKNLQEGKGVACKKWYCWKHIELFLVMGYVKQCFKNITWLIIGGICWNWLPDSHLMFSCHLCHMLRAGAFALRVPNKRTAIPHFFWKAEALKINITLENGKEELFKSKNSQIEQTKKQTSKYFKSVNNKTHIFRLNMFWV